VRTPFLEERRYGRQIPEHHALRWTATGLLEAEKKFRKVKGYRELAILYRKLNPDLTQQEQVA
jgi:hypothetical protein